MAFKFWKKDSHHSTVFESGDGVPPIPRRTYRSASESHIETLAETASSYGDSKPSMSRRDSISDPFGLTLVNTNSIQDPEGDIIFVHGVGGTSHKTWSYQRDTNYFWPPWLSLEPALSRFRIFTYGYSANVKSSQPAATITDFARDLLVRMLLWVDESCQRIGTVCCLPSQYLY